MLNIKDLTKHVYEFYKNAMKPYQSRKCINCGRAGSTVTAKPGFRIIIKSKDKKEKGKINVMTAHRAKSILRKLWENEKEMLIKIFPILRNRVNYDSDDIVYPTDIFFLSSVLANPPKFRPLV